MPGSPEEQTRLRIGLLDADPIRVVGFTAAFEQHSRLEFVPVDLAALVADLKLNLCILGLHGNVDVPTTLSTLRALRPDIKILLMGPEQNDQEMLSFVTGGAKGYLDETATPEVIEEAVEVVRDGSIYAPKRVLTEFVDRESHGAPAPPPVEIHLTAREHEVLQHLVSAQSNREIARALGIEERTVKAHIAKLMRKFGVDNRIALSVHAVQQAITAPTEDLGQRRS